MALRPMAEFAGADNITVSICCITYNHAQYIRDCLEGFLAQQVDFACEILIHDDASTDGTADIIREYAAEYPGLIFPILQTENQYSLGLTNVSGTWNFPRARGRYIAMCEGDDCWCAEDKLKLQADFMSANPGCSLCFHSAAVDFASPAFASRRMRPYAKDRRVEAEEIVDKVSGYPTASLFFRADTVKNLPDFYNNAPLSDIPLQLLCAERGWGFYMDRDMCIYRFGRPGSWTAGMKDGETDALLKKQNAYFAAIKDMYLSFDEHSAHVFHDAVESAVRRTYFQTRVNLSQLDEIFKKENAKFFRELPLSLRLLLRIQKTFPGLYEFLQKTFHRVAG